MKVAEFQTFSDFLFCLRQRKICHFYRKIYRSIGDYIQQEKRDTGALRISRYAFLIEDRDGYYAYSTLSNSLPDIDKEAFIFLKGIQNGNRELPAPDNLEEPFRSRSMHT